MKRTRSARTRVLVAGLAVTAVVCGSAAGAMPKLSFGLHARLAPVAGTTTAGDFEGLLAATGGGMRPATVVPRRAHRWQLAWKLDLPALRAPAVASIRIHATKTAPAVARVLCAKCTSTAQGTLAVPGSQMIRIARGDAVVVVQMRSARLRGVVHAVASRVGSSRR